VVDDSELFNNLSDLDDQLNEIDNFLDEESDSLTIDKKIRLKEIVVAIPEKEFDDFIQDIFELKSRWGLGTTSDIVIKAIRESIDKND
jgi:hypothetical protein